MVAHKDFYILYIDDEEQNLISFKATFRREYSVFTAHDTDEGYEILKNNPIHLIISDQRMPGTTGVEFFEKILPEYPDSIRMILTGFSDVEAIIGAINNGQVYRYITKPWDENELRMTIENSRQLYQLQANNKNLLFELKQKVEEQERTLQMFKKYVPEPVVQKALSSTADSIFDGELKEVTVLFCDIRGFTPMSEELSPKEVVKFLNTYYSMMTEIVKNHNGIVNQYVGDEIFAAFGAPLSYPNNEENAVFCALDMMNKLKDLNADYKEIVGRDIQMGIGINSGEVVAGNLGSEEKIDYSLTGDTVNTGKRIEMITKENPNKVLISQSVYEKTKNYVMVNPLEPLFVKGKKNKIQVYEVINRK